MRTVLRVPLLTVALVVAVAACGGGSTSEPEAADAGTDADGAPATATLLDGAELEWASLAGQDVVLWFWAPWCTTCRAEADDVVAAAAALDGQVEVVGVAGRGDVAEMEGFVGDTGTGQLRHVVDADGDVWSAYGVTTQPSFAFIDDSGEVEVVVGALGEQAITERMQALAEA